MPVNQNIIDKANAYLEIELILKKNNCKRFLLVCDKAYDFLFIKEYFEKLSIESVRFDDFTPNPLYEDVVKGVELLKSTNCDLIVAVGGGSAIDVAKCIKLFSVLDESENYLSQEFVEADIKLLAIPTTAGTGSESTRFAVCYYEGAKQSIAHDTIIPDYAILEPRFLATLPIYQKKCTAMDALSQAIESYWSVNSTEQSKIYAKKGMQMIVKYIDAYLENDEKSLEKMMKASNYSGRAINITQTTAAHAMSYKVTSLYGIPHGHAVAICLPFVWEFMVKNPQKCIDARGNEYLSKTFSEINEIFGTSNSLESIALYKGIMKKMELGIPQTVTDDELNQLIHSVNPVRLKNNPIELDEKSIKEIYEKALNIN